MAGPQERSDAGAKVTVACKIPAGLEIRGYTERTERETTQSGVTREFPVHRWNNEEAHINGPATPWGQAPKCQVICGYAITPNVRKDLWDQWYAANRDQPYIKNNLIFAYENADRLHGRARENEKALTGFEPIDADKPSLKVRGIVKADVR